MSSEFRRLRAYELAFVLARDINEAVCRWEKFERWSLGMQLRDDAGAHIPELARTLAGLIRKREPS
jgi:hypothetical protein